MANKKITKKTPAIKKAAAAAKTAPRKSKAVPRVLAALNAAQPVTSSKPADLHSMLAVLRDKEKPVEVRFAALQSLGAAGFSEPDFAAIQGD